MAKKTKPVKTAPKPARKPVAKPPVTTADGRELSPIKLDPSKVADAKAAMLPTDADRESVPARAEASPAQNIKGPTIAKTTPASSPSSAPKPTPSPEALRKVKLPRQIDAHDVGNTGSRVTFSGEGIDAKKVGHAKSRVKKSLKPIRADKIADERSRVRVSKHRIHAGKVAAASARPKPKK